MGIFDKFRRRKEKIDYTAEIMKHIGCECTTVEVKDVSSMMAHYHQALKEGRQEGYIPLIIIPSELMLESLYSEEYEDDQKDDRETILDKAREIDVKELLKRRLEDVMPDEEDDDEDEDIAGEFSIQEHVERFLSLEEVINKLIIIAKLPTDKPWEAAAWIPMGGFNECPAPEEQVAVFQYWYEKFGAIPALVTQDVWELYVENPPKTQGEAEAIAWEQFSFCGDIVFQGTGTVNELAGTLMDSSVWYFWWD